MYLCALRPNNLDLKNKTILFLLYKLPFSALSRWAWCTMAGRWFRPLPVTRMWRARQPATVFWSRWRRETGHTLNWREEISWEDGNTPPSPASWCSPCREGGGGGTGVGNDGGGAGGAWKVWCWRRGGRWRKKSCVRQMRPGEGDDEGEKERGG